MQPSAAEVERGARRSRHRPGTAAKPGARLDYQTANVCPRKATSGGKAGRSAAHDCHLDIIICHFRINARLESAGTYNYGVTEYELVSACPLLPFTHHRNGAAKQSFGGGII
jgi:hypothetical protein